MAGITPVQIVIVLAIVLVLFGTARLPEIGRSLGRGLREFRRAVTPGTDEDESAGPASG